MKALKFLQTEYPQSMYRIDDKSNLSWNEIETLLSRYDKHLQIKNNCDKQNVIESFNCDTCVFNLHRKTQQPCCDCTDYNKHEAI
jgi:hypothetical protein